MRRAFALDSVSGKRQTAWLFVTMAAHLAFAVPCLGHFVFVVPEADGTTSRIIMSETLTADDDVNVAIIKDAHFHLRELDGTEKPLTYEPVDAKHLRMATPGKGTRVIHGKVDLGVTTRGAVSHILVYYPKTVLGDSFDPRTVIGPAAPVELVPVAKHGKHGARLKLLVEGKSRPEAEVTLIHPDDASEKVMTDKDGLTPPLTAAGRYGAWARYWEEKSGTRDEKAYSQIRHYATLVFDLPEAADGSPNQNASIAKTQAAGQPDAAIVQRFTDLPYATSSFGAVACDGWLYVYGGHTAPTHEYHTESASGQFHRLDLSEKKEWQVLPGGPRLQGMNLAACDGAIYRIGGMESRNQKEDKVDNRSTARVARFDPAAMAWSDCASLPQPRSSHDVVEAGHRLYVLGGWDMRGINQKPVWLDYMDVLDLTASHPRWARIPQPFHRRALIAARVEHRIYAIGGFDEQSKPSLDVNIYDLNTGAWSDGPSLPAPVRNGFAPAAGVLDRVVYASVSNGSLYRLNNTGSTWELVAKSTPRIVHRAVPFGSKFLLLGGATAGDNLGLIEAVALNTPIRAINPDASANAPAAARPAHQVATPRGRTDVIPDPAAAEALAAGQKHCPIMTDAEIDDDSPAVEYRGHTIALCCEGCVRRWKRDPDAYADAAIKLLPQLAHETIPARKLKQVYCPVYADRVISERDIAVEYRGQKIYLFNQSALRQWNADPAQFADPALLPQLVATPQGVVE